VKRVAISQSNYIPWKGYFDQIDSVDEFVIYDRVDFTKRDWRSRNAIKTPQGLLWLTVPVMTKGRRGQAIDAVEIVDHEWATKHWKSISWSYKRAPNYEFAQDCLEKLYDAATPMTRLHDVNVMFIKELCDLIGIDTPISDSREYECAGGPTERLVDICRQTGCTHYVTGPAAKNYLDEQCFADAGIAVEYFTYEYDEYPQLHGEFVHAVSIVDTLAALGPGTRSVFRGGGLRSGSSPER
jgi:hypothetical protein